MRRGPLDGNRDVSMIEVVEALRVWMSESRVRRVADRVCPTYLYGDLDVAAKVAERLRGHRRGGVN